MDRDFAKQLAFLVNQPESWERLQAYANHRIEFLKEQLTREKDPRKVDGLQDSIRELRRILTLREEVNSIANSEKQR